MPGERITHENPYTPSQSAWRAHLTAARGQGEQLDARVAAEAGSLLNFDFGGVRIHRDEFASQAANAMDARAYTYGEHIFVRSGENVGDVLMHELSHVVEQSEQSPVIHRAPAAVPPPATYLICYGSPRLNPGTPYEHNVGLQMKYAAEAKQREITARLGKAAAQNTIVVAYTPTEVELRQVLNKQYALPVKEVHVYSHGWEQGVNLGGQDPGWGKKGAETAAEMEERKMRPADLDDYKVQWAEDPSVVLYGCNVGNDKAGAPMAQSTADKWGVPVTAPSTTSHFDPGGFGTMQVPDKGGKMNTFTPGASSVDEHLTAIADIVKTMSSREMTKKRGLVASVRGSLDMARLRAQLDPHLEWLNRVLGNRKVPVPDREAKIARLAALIKRADALANANSATR
ncbi:hypothetical protein Rhe02_84710 [Rhizocola hellebori]|uniref:DUF4157 domain-containing protein n=1 Tax=Rhizocola hellebori TaxID=1392758 RepID=A0A8J3VKF0_9ACTN|nr:DUF4157 domain-containing protein [Rhizocola hellebori]GIH10404.1 hypothetical protein Rhe02_84710 [Rhizocola hellebori]